MAITATAPYLTTINRNFNPPALVLMHPALKDMPMRDEPEHLPLDVYVPSCYLRRRGGFSSGSGEGERSNPTPANPRMKRRGAICYSEEEESATYIRNLVDAQAKRAKSEAQRSEQENLVKQAADQLPSSRMQVRRGSSQYLLAQTAWELYTSSFIGPAIDEEEGPIMSTEIRDFLKTADNWDFDIFSFAKLTGGRPLVYLGLYLFEKHDLVKKFGLDTEKLTQLLARIEDSYHPGNYYHNSRHAADVTQAMHCLISNPKIYNSLTDVEIFSVILGAICHDADHPGVNQTFLVNSSSYLATLHGTNSLLEKHHVFTAKVLLIQSGLLDHLPTPEKDDIIHLMEDLILATDVVRHKEFLAQFEKMLDSEDGINLSDVRERRFLLTIAIKTADISNPARPLHISKQWSYLIMEEFFQQGDLEKENDMPLSFLCDRSTTEIPKAQAGFFEFCALPLFKAWARFDEYALSTTMCHNLVDNKDYWNKESQLLAPTPKALPTEVPKDQPEEPPTEESTPPEDQPVEPSTEESMPPQDQPVETTQEESMPPKEQPAEPPQDQPVETTQEEPTPPEAEVTTPPHAELAIPPPNPPLPESQSVQPAPPRAISGQNPRLPLTSRPHHPPRPIEPSVLLFTARVSRTAQQSQRGNRTSFMTSFSLKGKFN